LDAAAEIAHFTEGMDYAAFAQDAKTLKAVTANFAIIGEAANHVPDEIRESHPEIAWNQMRNMRNIIVHVYHGVDPAIVWDTLKNDLPDLLRQLERLIKET
jgi:uncharacterized protein with HEPN domain